MENALQSEKVGVDIFSQFFCDQLENIPIKKRIALRDSALYQPTTSSDNVCSLTWHTDPSSKQSSDNLMTSLLDGNGSRVVVLHNEKSVSTPDSPRTETLVGSTLSYKTYTLDSANKVPSIEAVPHCTDTTLSSASCFLSDAKNDGLDSKGDEHVRHFTSDITGDSYPVGKSSIQPAPRNNLKAVQPVTKEVKIQWDLNVAVYEWGEPKDLQNVESQSNITSFEIMASTKFDKSEDFKLKGETIMPVNEVSPESTYSLGCESVSNNQHVAAGTCLNRKLSGMEPSEETVSMNISCYQKRSSETDEHLTPTIFDSASKSSDEEPKRNYGSSFETTNYYVQSTELPKCENISIATTGESSNVDNDSSKSKNAIAGEHEVTFMDLSDHHMDLLKQRAYVEEINRLENITENKQAATVLHHSSNGMTKRSNVEVSFVEPICEPGHCNQDGTAFKQVVNIDKYCGAQTDQDYEDGELRDIDIHCCNEIEIEMGEAECLDYEPISGNTGNLDESSTSVSMCGKDEKQLNSKKHLSSEILKNQLVAKDCASSDKKMISGLYSEVYFGTHYSSMQLDRRLSGWDQLPKYDHAFSDKVVERGIRSRPKEVDSSYFTESCSGFGKYTAEWQSTPHMHQDEDWVSEHRTSVNYHDIYDKRSGYNPLIVNSKGLEGLRSRSPSVRSEDYDSHFNYSRYLKERYSRHAEGSGRRFRGARNGHRGSLTDDRIESGLCVRQQFIRGDQSYSHRATPHFSKNFNRSRSRSRTRSPPMWLSRYERMNSRGHLRQAEFGTEDREKGTRSLFRKSSFASDNDLHYSSPRGRFIPHNKPRWHDEDDIEGPRNRSPVRQLRHKVILKAAGPRGRFKPSEEFRPMGYRGSGRIHEIASPHRVRGYNGGSDRRKPEYSIEAGHQKHFYKDDSAWQYQNDAEDDTETQTYPLN